MADLTLGRPVESFLRALAPPPQMPRKRRIPTKCAWSLDRQGQNWLEQEDNVVRACWHRPHDVSVAGIAALLHRSTASVAQRACTLNLGLRAPPHGQEAPALAAPEGPVAPLPLYDGVVMTPRLEFAWHTVLGGVRVDVVLAATPSLTSVEIAALRRWHRSL